MKTKLLSFLCCTFAILSISSCVYPDGSYVGHSSVSLSVLPSGYQTVYVSGSPYYYVGNTWYRRGHGGYVSCPRPYGYRGTLGSSYYGGYGDDYVLTSLPRGYRTVSYGGVVYYNHGSSWYRRNGGRYHSCAAPRGYNNHYPTSYHSGHNHYSGHNHHSNYSDHSNHYSNHRSSHSYSQPTYSHRSSNQDYGSRHSHSSSQPHVSVQTPPISQPSSSSNSSDNSHKSRSHYMNSLKKN